MKFRPYGKYGKKDYIAFVLFFLISGSIICWLAGGLYLMWHIPYESTMLYEIDESEFIEVNYSRLAEMADIFNSNYDNNNTPLDYTLTVYWKDTNYTEIESYGTAGDAAIWSGMNLAAQSLHYTVAKRSGDLLKTSYALQLVEKALRGVSILIAVPSGGIGENFPAILSRSVCPKDWTELGNPPIHHYREGEIDPKDIFSGTGPYSNYWWKGYPSTDQWSGIILGLGQCAKVFMEEEGSETEWVRVRVKDLVIQIIESFIKSKWMILDQSESGNSRTTGQDFKASLEMTGVWLLSLLKTGMTACPEKYTELYYHYALERNYINWIETDLRIFNLFNYYSLNINYNMLTNLVSLEDDPSLRIRYENIVKEIYYPIIRISRNAWFNMGYLYMMHRSELSDYIEDELQILKDVEDQMMRFDVPRSPTGNTRVPDRGGDKNPIRYEFHDPTEEYRQNPIINLLYGILLDMLARNVSYYAKRVDEYQGVDFLWQRTPWEDHPGSPIIRQDSGLAFFLPYYIGRYLNVFPESDYGGDSI